VSDRAPGTGKGLYLARHGQTAYNLEGRFQGQLPVPLDDTGRAQAAELAERAAAHYFAKLWCSPLLRARETADIVAARIGLEPQEDPRLMETDAGDWTDRSAFPGGESFAQQGVRVAASLAEMEQGTLPALVVCHGGVIRIAIFQRVSRSAAMDQRVPNGALVRLDPAAAEVSDLEGNSATQAS
jgi:broad specificity phosphatase PhoE